jgi:preprotein translocase subunit SecG
MLTILITVVHVVACFFLVVVVLLQTGKGADIGAVFGGSSQTIFGSSGAGNLLTRLTTWTAVIFMFTSLYLTWSATKRVTHSIADTIPASPPPISEPAKTEDVGAPTEGGAAGGAAAQAGSEAEKASAAEAAKTRDTAASAGEAAKDGAKPAPAAEGASGGAAAPASGTGGEHAAPANP